MVESQVPGAKLFRRGKVREVYEAGDDKLVIVASDRLSAFDVVLPTPIPDKGKVLTQLSSFWFRKTEKIVPNHLVASDVRRFPKPFREAGGLGGRARLVDRCGRSDAHAVAPADPPGAPWARVKAPR